MLSSVASGPIIACTRTRLKLSNSLLDWGHSTGWRTWGLVIRSRQRWGAWSGCWAVRVRGLCRQPRLRLRRPGLCRLGLRLREALRQGALSFACWLGWSRGGRARGGLAKARLQGLAEARLAFPHWGRDCGLDWGRDCGLGWGAAAVSCALLPRGRVR